MGEHTSIHVFQKTYNERLEEYTSILSAQDKLVPASQIHTEWCCDVELVIEPIGWQALWNISRFTCEDYHICYPTTVLVDVLSMDNPTLHALVKVIAVQDDKLQLAEKHEVPLIELYPTIKQTNSALDVIGTAHCIDRLRFFYNNLWMPWDEDDDEDTDWVKLHLEPRLKLHFDMKSFISKETCEIIKSLTSEGREIRNKIMKLEHTLPDDAQEDMHEETCMLMQLHFRLQQIKAEVDLLENPSIRNFLEKNRSVKDKKKSSDNADQNKTHYFVWQGGTVKEFQEASSKIQTMLSEDLSIKVSGHLEEVLNVCEVGDTIFLGEGRHRIKHSSGLAERGTIMGICNTENTILCPRDMDVLSSLLNFSSAKISLSNICIELGELQAGIIARKECTVIMTGCRIRVPDTNASSVKWGVVAMPGAKLMFSDTVFQGLGTAVVMYGMSEVVLNKCRFEQCCEGVRVNDNAYFTANECSFKDIEFHAIVMESETVAHSETKIGGTELLADMSEILLNECKFDNEKSIILKPKGAIAPCRYGIMI